jgi:hypothetical protein
MLVNAVRMARHGRWLQREGRRGRFHFFPLEEIVRRLEGVGLEVTQSRLSYSDQAYLVAARKRGQSSSHAA